RIAELAVGRHRTLRPFPAHQVALVGRALDQRQPRRARLDRRGAARRGLERVTAAPRPIAHVDRAEVPVVGAWGAGRRELVARAGGRRPGAGVGDVAGAARGTAGLASGTQRTVAPAARLRGAVGGPRVASLAGVEHPISAAGRTAERQSSVPVFGSVAAKKSLPPTAVSSCGFELSGPGLMSPTSTVPAAVPSLFQSSRPFVGSEAAKKSVPFVFARSPGKEWPLPGLMSLTSTVLAAVPSLFQSSRPFVGS